MSTSLTTAPDAPTTIKRLPVEYDQQINVFLGDIIYNAAQGKAMCFVTDNMGVMTESAKSTAIACRDAIIGGADGSIVDDFVTDVANYAVLSDDGNVVEIYRPYYAKFKTIGMLKIVENLDFTKLVALDPAEGASTDQDFADAFNEILASAGNNQRGN